MIKLYYALGAKTLILNICQKHILNLNTLIKDCHNLFIANQVMFHNYLLDYDVIDYYCQVPLIYINQTASQINECG